MLRESLKKNPFSKAGKILNQNSGFESSSRNMQKGLQLNLDAAINQTSDSFS